MKFNRTVVILNNTSFNNILGKTDGNQELEAIGSKEKNITESQHDSIEIPTEVLISTNELDSTNDQTDTDEPSSIEELLTIDEESYLPTDKEKEIWEGCLELINPYLTKMQTVTSTLIVDGIKSEIVSKAKNYFNSVDGVTDWVIMEFSKRVADYTSARYSELQELNKEKIQKQLQQSSRYAAFC